MKKMIVEVNKIIVWAVFLSISYAEEIDYPEFLENDYSKTHLSSAEFQSYAKKCGINGCGDRRSLINRILGARFKKSLSLNHEDEEYTFGLYFSNYLGAEWTPYVNVFGRGFWTRRPYVNTKVDEDYSPNKFNTSGEQFGRLLTDLKCKIIDLCDASISLSDLEHLSEIKTLETLSLPRQMEFNDQFYFPGQIKTLVVRGSRLTEYFFEALRNLHLLERLVIIDCSTTLEYQKITFLDYYGNGFPESVPKLSNGALPNLEYLSIKQSHPDIFNYMVANRWESLEAIDIDLYDENIDAMIIIFGHEDVISHIFPSLDSIKIRMTPYAHEIYGYYEKELKFSNYDIEVSLYETNENSLPKDSKENKVNYVYIYIIIGCFLLMATGWAVCKKSRKAA